jgi:Na+/proline symporter
MDQLRLIDWLVIGAFLVLTFGIGIWTARGIKQSSDFFLSGRKLGPALQFFINFGQMTDATGAPQLTSFVYQSGVSGVWLSFQTLFLTPIYWFSAIWFRRTRLVTGSDLFIDRFNSRGLARTFAWYFVFLVPMYMGLGNIVSYKVAASMFSKPESAYTAGEKESVAKFYRFQDLRAKLEKNTIAPEEKVELRELDSLNNRGLLLSFVSYIKPIPFYIGYTLFVAGYIILGGIKGAALADALQGILIIILSALMIPIGLRKVGGLSGLHHQVPDVMFRLFGSDLSGLGWLTVFAYVLNGVASLPAPTWITNNAAARNETALRVGMLGGAFCKRLIMIAWMFCALLAVAILPHGISDPDQAWGMLSTDLLAPGLLGLMISGMLLGHMPLVAVAAVNFSATFTRNIYEEIVPERSPKHYLFVAQASIIGVLIAGVLVALLFTGILEIYTAILTFVTFMGTIAWLIYFWRGLTAQAVAVGLVIWIVLMGIVPWILPQFESFRENPILTQRTVGTPDHPATAMFFDSVAQVDPRDPASPWEGLRRFNVENFIVCELGLPLQNFTKPELKAIPFFFSAFAPAMILITLSYLIPVNWRRKKPAPRPAQGAIFDSQSEDVRAQIRRLVEGNRSLLFNDYETPEEEALRIRRFYAKLQTPIGPTEEEDERELLLSFMNPERFDHLKLFPRSNWQLSVWSRQDIIGFGACCLGVLLLLGLLIFLLGWGA